MYYPIDVLQKEIRVILDQNSIDDNLVSDEDSDTLKLDDLIKSKIIDAARIIETSAPHHMLDAGYPFATDIVWNSKSEGNGSGYTILPNDFLRLVVFRMSDWLRSVYTPIFEDSPDYAKQMSRFPGIKGNPSRPVVAIVTSQVGLKLEFYSCNGGSGVYVEEAKYLRTPKEEEDNTIDLCFKLKPAIIYYAAGMVATTLGADQLANTLIEISKTLQK